MQHPSCLNVSVKDGIFEIQNLEHSWKYSSKFSAVVKKETEPAMLIINDIILFNTSNHTSFGASNCLKH